jgi:hypothetical protein
MDARRLSLGGSFKPYPLIPVYHRGRYLLTAARICRVNEHLVEHVLRELGLKLRLCRLVKQQYPEQCDSCFDDLIHILANFFFNFWGIY